MIKHTTYHDASTGIRLNSAAKLLLIALALITLASFKQVSAQMSLDSNSIPIGTDSYKIMVNEDGIYEVTYEDLQAAGMDVASIDPTTFQMMHKGMPMAYQLIGNGDNVFDPGEAVRFFGWAFDGSKHDLLYVNENYYWLWANGTPLTVESRASFPGGMAVDSWRSTVIFEEDVNFNFTRTNDWEEWIAADPDTTFEEADAWFWARMASHPENVKFNDQTGPWTTPNEIGPITPEMGQPFREYTVTVHDPMASGTTATMTTEVFSWCKSSEVEVHVFSASLNGVVHEDTWTSDFGRSFDQDIPANTLIDGDNLLRYDALTPSENIKATGDCGVTGQNSDLLHPNRSILEYDRALAAVDDQLWFEYATSGTHDFMVSGFTTGSAADAIVWEVTDRAMPSVITLSDAEVTGDAGAFTWTIGDENVNNSEYIATSVVKSPASVSQYVAPSIEKTNVEWLAIAHPNFMEQANRMADYRGGTTTDVTLSDGTVVPVSVEVPRNTFVADVNDVINQYGYGYNIPQAIQAYFNDAYRYWSEGELKYGILFGDATINPRQLECVELCDSRGEWFGTRFGEEKVYEDFQTYVVTDLLFVDRFSGFIPTDHTFANLVDDEPELGIDPHPGPEIAVGRFAVNTLEEAKNMVDKVILYEYNQQIDAEYLENLIFIADNADGGGDFCKTIRDVTDEVDELTRNTFTVDRDYVNEFSTFIDGTSASGGNPYCMDTYMTDNGIAESAARPLIRDDVFAEINSTGAAIVNYRGHGGRASLSGIVNANRDVDDTFNPENGGIFTNADRPVVWISADCLDGDFAYPSKFNSALSERMLRLGGLTGTAAHWSSTGLGFDREHTAMHQGFYESLYTANADGEPRGPYTIGDAIVYTKNRYMDNNLGNVAEVWAFTFQGDPAMAMPDSQYVENYGDFDPTPFRDPTVATVSSTEIAPTSIYLPVVFGALIATTVVSTVRRYISAD